MGPVSTPARTFASRRRVRLGDVAGSSAVRLDALACYLQDVATDDAEDVGLADGWVLRRLALRVHELPRFRDEVELVTWCSGLSATAAERCTTLRVDDRPAVDATALWVFLGADGRPARIDRSTFAAYGADTLERRISTRLEHADPPIESTARPWPLRAADVDVLGHVNNAVSLAAIEDVFRDLGGEPTAPRTVEVEYRASIELTDEPELFWSHCDGALVGGLCCDGDVRTTFRVTLRG
jgi:acyl-ACP thioesterase